MSWLSKVAETGKRCQHKFSPTYKVTNNFITGTKINGDGLMNQNGNSYNRMMDFNNIIIGITSNASNRN